MKFTKGERERASYTHREVSIQVIRTVYFFKHSYLCMFGLLFMQRLNGCPLDLVHLLAT